MNSRAASWPASCAKSGMPATMASRSADPDPATRTTAGWRSRPCADGVVSVPTSPNPAAEDLHVEVGGIAEGLLPRGDTGHILARDELRPRDIELRQAAAIVHRDLGFNHARRVLEATANRRVFRAPAGV